MPYILRHTAQLGLQHCVPATYGYAVWCALLSDEVLSGAGSTGSTGTGTGAGSGNSYPVQRRPIASRSAQDKKDKGKGRHSSNGRQMLSQGS